MLKPGWQPCDASPAKMRKKNFEFLIRWARISLAARQARTDGRREYACVQRCKCKQFGAREFPECARRTATNSSGAVPCIANK